MRALLRGLSLRGYSLLLVNALIALGLARAVWHDTETNSLLGTAPGRALMLPTLPVEHSARTALGGIQERALFHTTRRFFVAVDPHALPATPPQPNYELVGTLIIPRKPAVALLKQHATNLSRKVKPGDDLDGWMVEAVERSRVVMSYQDHHAEIARSDAQSGKAVTGALRVVPLVRTAERLSMSGAVRTLGKGGSPLTPTAGPESADLPHVYRPPQ